MISEPSYRGPGEVSYLQGAPLQTVVPSPRGIHSYMEGFPGAFNVESALETATLDLDSPALGGIFCAMISLMILVSTKNVCASGSEEKT